MWFINTQKKLLIHQSLQNALTLNTKVFKQVEYESIVWGVFLIFLTSQISIPLEPVPITLQTCSILFIGLVLEQKAAIQSVVYYLILGMVGMPVFANFSGGYPHLLGPTGGYLIGFLVSVIVMTRIRRFFHNQNVFYMFTNCLLGTAVIFIMGLGWLYKFVGFETAIRVGLIPFILPGFIKAIVLTLLVYHARRKGLLKDRRS